MNLISTDHHRIEARMDSPWNAFTIPRAPLTITLRMSMPVASMLKALGSGGELLGSIDFHDDRINLIGSIPIRYIPVTQPAGNAKDQTMKMAAEDAQAQADRISEIARTLYEAGKMEMDERRRLASILDNIASHLR